MLDSIHYVQLYKLTFLLVHRTKKLLIHVRSTVCSHGLILLLSLVPEKNPDTPTVSRSSEDNALSVSWNRIECESGSPYIKAYRLIYCVRDQADDNCTRKYKHHIYGPRREKACLQGLANNREADQPVHQHRLISAFILRFWKVSYPNLLQAEFQLSS